VSISERTGSDFAGTLGAFTAGLRVEVLPSAAVERATQLIVDVIGLMLGGARTALGRQTAEFAASVLPGSSSTIVGDRRRASVEGAAFANATIAKIVGMEDTNRAYGHVAVEVIPAALAAAEAHHRDGRNLVEAVVAGYEVFGRVGRQVRRSHLERGLDIKGTVGSLAAAAAAAHAMGLDAAKTAHAIGLATSLASGLETYAYDPEHSHTEHLISGFAARNGVSAANMAAAGFRSPRGSIEGPNGFLRAFGAGPSADRADVGLAADLGASFEIVTAGVKPHSGCRHVHQAVDAAREVRRQGALSADAIERVDVGTYAHAVAAPFRVTKTPETPGEAAFSLPAATAIGLLHGGFYLEDIARFSEPPVRALTQKVACFADAAISAQHPQKNGCVIRVTLADGSVREGRVEYAKGEPENMLTRREFEEKFRMLAGDHAASYVDAWLRRLWSAPDVPDAGALVSMTEAPR
jgi:2-methylcitrate dehydratase PrpD